MLRLIGCVALLLVGAAHSRSFPGLSDGEDDCKWLECSPGSTIKALIPGDVDKCTAGVYCQCSQGIATKQQCKKDILFFQTQLNPDTQECEWRFNCEEWISDHPTTPSPTTTPTTVSPTTEPTTASPTTQPTTPSPTTEPTTASPTAEPTTPSPTTEPTTPDPTTEPATAESSSDSPTTVQASSETPSMSSTPINPINPSTSPDEASSTPVNPTNPSTATTEGPETTTSPTTEATPVTLTTAEAPGDTTPAPGPGQSTCQPATETTAAAPGTTSPQWPPLPAPETCTRKMGDILLPCPGDSSKYIRCFDGLVWVMSCAPGTIFSYVKQTCDFPWDVGCNGVN